MPVKNNVILYESFAGAGMIDSPYAIFLEFLRNKKFDDYIHIWIINNFESNNFRLLEYADKPNVRFILYGSNDYLKYISIAHYLINNNTFPTYWTKKPEQIYVNTWHGIPRKKLFFDIPNNKMNTGNVMRNFLSADYLLASDDSIEKMYLGAARLNGLCNDKIIRTRDFRKELIISKKQVFKQLEMIGMMDLSKERKPIALYAPTWRDGKYSIDTEIIRELGNYGYRVLVKAHHVDYENRAKYIPSSIDINTLFPICDLLVTDYSSVFYDWINYGDNPVIFYAPDYEEYCQKQGLYQDFPCAPAKNIETFKTYLENLDDYWEKVQRQVWGQGTNVWTDKDINVYEFLEGFLSRAGFNTPKANDKKRLLFYAGDFKPNGVTSSILSLFNRIDYSKYDVSLILLKKDNPDYLDKINEINPNVRLLVRAGTYNQTLLEHCANEICLKKGTDSFELDKMFPRELYRREWRRCFGDTHFDAIINFTGYSPFYAYFFGYGIKNSPTTQKIIWQHNIMKLDQMREIDGKYPLKDSLNAVYSTYCMYDKIVSVSEQCLEANKKDFPFYEFKMALVHNFIVQPYDLFEKLNSKYANFEPHSFSTEAVYLNVARLSPAKNQLNLIKAFKDFHVKYNKTQLYIMGDGELRDKILKEIKDCDFIHLIPYNKNPFVNMRYANYNILPSIYEGQGLSIIEAKVLGKKTIVTDFGADKGVTNVADILIHGTDEYAIRAALEDSIHSWDKPVIEFDPYKYNEETKKEFDSLF